MQLSKLFLAIGGAALLSIGCVADADDPATVDDSSQDVRGPVGIRALTLSSYDERFWGDYPEFSGGVVKSSRAELVPMLEDARERRFRIWLGLVTKRSAPGNVFDRDLALDEINEYAGLDLDDYRDVLVGIYLIDEPQLEARWGPGGVPFDVVDRVLARRAHQVFPGFPISVRLSPTTLEDHLPDPRFVDVAWGTYKPGRSGELGPWMARERAAAARLGVEIEWTINPYEAPGDGPFMSAALLRTVGVAMAKDGESYGVNLWTKLSTGQDPVVELQRPAVRDALRAIARAMVAKQ